MYRAEVLGKLPVIQHFLFGSLLLYDGPIIQNQAEGEGDAHSGHAHALGGDSGWGDCCGIPVPSAFGAAAEAQKQRLEGPSIRQIPFD